MALFLQNWGKTNDEQLMRRKTTITRGASDPLSLLYFRQVTGTNRMHQNSKKRGKTTVTKRISETNTVKLNWSLRTLLGTIALWVIVPNDAEKDVDIIQKTKHANDNNRERYENAVHSGYENHSVDNLHSP